jgi:hypothetical protein
MMDLMWTLFMDLETMERAVKRATSAYEHNLQPEFTSSIYFTLLHIAYLPKTDTTISSLSTRSALLTRY